MKSSPRGVVIEVSSAVPTAEISGKFLQGMADRMAASYHKYGPVADSYPLYIDAIASLKARLEQYALDGNVEWLMDVANFAMIEYMRPRHHLAHFRAEDSNESAGGPGPT